MRPDCLLSTLTLCTALVVLPFHQASGQSSAEPIAGTAQATAVALDDRYWVPEAYFGLRLGNSRVIGEAGTIIPFTQYPDRLLFGDARGRLDDRDSREFNLGLGYRQLILEDQLLVGGYAYFDQLRSRWDNTFRQLTVGSEFQAERWSARVNAYRAGSSASAVDDRVRVETDLSGGAEPTLQLVDSYLFFQSPGGTETTYQAYERAINGADIEAGFMLPLRSDAQQLWLHGGWYRFTAGDVPTVSGPRVRADWRVPLLQGASGARLNVGFEWQRDSVRGSQRFARLEFRMPIGGDRARRVSAGHDRWYRQRMTQAPVRDVDVITGVQERVIDFREFEPVRERAIFADSGMTVGRVVYASALGGGDGSPGSPAGLEHAAANLVESYGLLVLDGSGGALSEVAVLGVDHLRVLSGGASVELRGTATAALTAVFSSDGQAAVLTQPLSIAGDGIVVDTLNMSAGLIADGVNDLSILRSTLGDVQLNQTTGLISFRDSIASSLSVDGGNATIGFDDGQLSRGIAGSVIDIRNTTGSTVSISAPIHALDGAGGVTLHGNTDGSFGFSGSQILLSTGTHDAIHLSGNTGSDIAFTPDVLAIDTSGGAGVHAAAGGRLEIAAGEATVSTVGAGAALSLEGLAADIRLDSVVSESATDTAISLLAVSGVVDVGSASILNAGNDGIRLSGGAAQVGFGTIDIDGAGRTGINFTDSNVTFSAQTLNVDGGETAIDLTRASGTIDIASGGVLRNFGTVGVQFSAGDDFSDSANTLFTFGGGSVIAGDGAFVMDTVGLNPALGLYDFTGTDFSGPFRMTPGGGQIGELFFVAANATGSGDGSSIHHLATAGTAQNRADSGELTTFVFVNDGDAVDFGSLANSTFTLAAGQVITGFGSGNTLDHDRPINILGDFAESAITDPTGNGAALLTTAAGNVITLGDDNRIGHVTIAGGENALNGNGFAGLLVQNTEFGAAGSHLFSFVDASGALTLSNNAIDVAGDLLNVQGGDAELLLSAGSGTLIGRGVRVVGTTGGSVRIIGASLRADGAAAVTLDNNVAGASLTDTSVASATDHYLFSIDQGSGSTGDITLTNVTQSGALAGGAFNIGAGLRNIDAGGFNLTAGNLPSNLIDIHGQSGGTISLGTISSDGHAASDHVIRLTGQSGGTVNFGSLNIDNFSNVGGNALVLDNMAGTVSFNGITRLSNVSGSGLVADNISGEITVHQLIVDGADGYGLLVGDAGASSGGITVNDGSIDGTASGGILVNNANLSLNELTLGGNGALANTGIEVVNNDGTDRVLSINTTTVTAQAAGINIVQSGAGDLRLALDGNTVNAGTGVGIGADGSAGAGELLITSLIGNTVNTAGNGGIVVDGAIFDADPDAAGIQQVAGGNTTIGNLANTASVSGRGLWLNDVLGDLAFGDLNIGNDAGTGLFIRDADKGGVEELLFSNTGGSIVTTHGTAMDIDPVTMASVFTSVSSSDAPGHGLFIDQISGNIAIGATMVNSAGGSGIVVSDSDGDFGFGATSITGTGNHGLSLNGATGGIAFNGLNIEGANSTGVDFESFSGTFTADTLNVNGGVTAIDLTNAGGTITVINGGTLQNFTGSGVQFSRNDHPDDSANALFTFGGGSINATPGAYAVDAIGLNPASGQYDFSAVDLTGDSRFTPSGGQIGELYFVAANSTGSGDGRDLDNLAGIADAQVRADSGDLITFVFVNDGNAIDFTGLANNSFTLSSGQAVGGFGNNNEFAMDVPVNLIGDFPGTVISHTGGAATLTTTAGNVITLADGNQIRNLSITGGSNSLFGSDITDLTVQNSEFGAAGNYLFNLVNPAGNITLVDNSIAVAGNVFSLDGGTADVLLGASSGSLTGHGVRVVNTTGGSVQISNGSFQASGGAGVTLNNNMAAVTLTDIAVGSLTDHYLFSIDQGSGSSGTITLTDTSLGNYTGGVFDIGAGARTLDAGGLNIVGGNQNQRLINISGQSGGALNFGSITSTNQSSAADEVIRVVNQTGGSVNFGNVGITGFSNAGNTAVSLQGGTGATMNFASLNVETAAGHAVAATGLAAGNRPTLAIGNSNNITSGSGRALHLQDLLIDGGGITLDSVSSTNSTSQGINLDNVTGHITFGSATVTGATGDGVRMVSGGTGNYTFNALNVTNSAGIGVNAISAGTLRILGANNTIATTNGTGLVMDGTTIGVGGISFLSVNASGGTHGILLQDTGSTAGLTVTGNGAAVGDGGVISGTSNDAVRLSNTSHVSLNGLSISSTGRHGVYGNTVTHFTLSNSLISGAGDGANEHGIFFENLFGSGANANTLDNVTVQDSFTHNIVVANSARSGSLTVGQADTLNINNSSIRDTTSAGASGVRATSSADGNLMIRADNSDFINNRRYGIHALGTGGRMHLEVSDSDFGVGAGNQQRHVVLEMSSVSGGSFDIRDNTMSGAADGADAAAIEIRNTGTGITVGFIRGNVIEYLTTSPFRLINIDARTNNGHIITEISNNTLTMNPSNAVGLDIVDGIAIRAIQTGRIDASVLNNTISVTSSGVGGELGAVAMYSGSAGGQDNRLCVNLNNNHTTVTGGSIQTSYFVDYFAGTNLHLQGYGGGSSNIAAVVNFLESRDSNPNVADAWVFSSGSPFSVTHDVCQAP